MNFDRIKQKLSVLSDAAKYDVSCSSSGSKRANKNKGLGDTNGMGICHTYTEDGRCVSLLKILLTNVCIYDCAYCVSRKSNDVKREAFTVKEVVDLTINFYRRNYIEGLFLSSGIFKNADYTMERLVRIAKKLRTEEKFNGYIHLKTIPGCSNELMHEAGLYADRVSVNIELPTESGLKLLAPDKKREDMIKPMQYVKNTLLQVKDERKVIKSTPKFVPAGQSTQMIIGATPETDRQIILTANHFYTNMNLKRVYYSGYVPVLADSRLPATTMQVPMLRENRLYQADWLMRFYGFKADEILEAEHPDLDTEIDPKLAWALRNMDQFPVDVNKADLHMILRVPGIGLHSARKIVAARKFNKLNAEQLKKLGIALNRAKYFLHWPGIYQSKDYTSNSIRAMILQDSHSKYHRMNNPQLQLF